MLMSPMYLKIFLTVSQTYVNDFLEIYAVRSEIENNPNDQMDADKKFKKLTEFRSPSDQQESKSSCFNC